MFSFTRSQSRLRIENSRSRSRPRTGRLRNPGGHPVFESSGGSAGSNNCPAIDGLCSPMWLPCGTEPLIITQILISCVLLGGDPVVQSPGGSAGLTQVLLPHRQASTPPHSLVISQFMFGIRNITKYPRAEDKKQKQLLFVCAVVFDQLVCQVHRQNVPRQKVPTSKGQNVLH